MNFVWLMTTAVIFVSFFDNGNVKGNNLEIQVTQRLHEITDLKERMDSLQKNIEWYISTFLNNKFLTKINSMVQGLVQEKVIRINLEKKFKSMEKWRVPKQVNGGWTAWGSWTSCSSTCGKGIKNRVRTCTNPAPANGGNYCDGVGMEYNECQINSCEVNGGWTLWTSWDQCLSSTGCGSGIQAITRACTNPRPAHGGKYCDGDAIRYRECLAASKCKVLARLVSGRLEVRVNGIWGTVCHDNFTTKEATVACRMLEKGRTGSVIEADSVPDGEDPIWLDDVSCSGTEKSLFQCDYNGHIIGRHNCNHGEDVGVRCS